MWIHWTRNSSHPEQGRATQLRVALYSFSRADHKYMFVCVHLCIYTCIHVHVDVHGLCSCLVSVDSPFSIVDSSVALSSPWFSVSSKALFCDATVAVRGRGGCICLVQPQDCRENLIKKSCKKRSRNGWATVKTQRSLSRSSSHEFCYDL